MQNTCPTIKIVGQSGQPLIIDLSCYDEKKHKVFGEVKPSFDKKALTDFLDSKEVKYAANISNKKLQALVDETVNTLSVEKHEEAFIIVNGNGDQVGDESYETEDKADEMLKMLTGK